METGKSRVRAVRVGKVTVGGRAPMALIAGVCVIESREMCLAVARRLCALARRHDIPLIFKASYDKANRTSHRAFRGPGLERGLQILKEVKERYGLPVLVDVHCVREVAAAAEVADVLQLPAFLSRQTDLALALGASGRAVNIKKGQFLAPWDIEHIVAKIESTGNRRVLITERGTCFGYNNLVADMRSLVIMRQFGYPVVFDATHSVQLPGARGGASGGDRRMAAYLARAAVAVGCDAVFLEVHPEPEKALSDAATSLPLRVLGRMWTRLSAIDALIRNKSGA
ncbi:MAG TPA: 3-deoxy-8-phosphooctulonate synthase [Kiritimatiellae bacterium]|nr:3-deoxy-8-phosphooctulonate synthase [Kiritimatiellia bacterium]